MPFGVDLDSKFLLPFYSLFMNKKYWKNNTFRLKLNYSVFSVLMKIFYVNQFFFYIGRKTNNFVIFYFICLINKHKMEIFYTRKQYSSWRGFVHILKPWTPNAEKNRSACRITLLVNRGEASILFSRLFSAMICLLRPEKILNLIKSTEYWYCKLLSKYICGYSCEISVKL